MHPYMYTHTIIITYSDRRFWIQALIQVIMQIGKYCMPIARATFQEVSGWSSRVIILLLLAYVRVRSRSRAQIRCVNIFTLQKNLLTKFSPIACIGEIGEISAYTVIFAKTSRSTATLCPQFKVSKLNFARAKKRRMGNYSP